MAAKVKLPIGDPLERSKKPVGKPAPGAPALGYVGGKPVTPLKPPLWPYAKMLPMVLVLSELGRASEAEPGTGNADNPLGARKVATAFTTTLATGAPGIRLNCHVKKGSLIVPTDSCSTALVGLNTG
jgi:hypothetical protein